MAPRIGFFRTEDILPILFFLTLSLLIPLSFPPMSPKFENKYEKIERGVSPTRSLVPRREAEDAEGCRRPPGAVQLWEEA